MPLAIPGFPDNVVAVAYRRAAADEHWFEPSGSDAPGFLLPGPTKDVVLVVAAATGHSLRYDIDSDTTKVIENCPITPHPDADISADIPQQPLRSHSLQSFEAISQKLLNGSVLKAARASWPLGRHIRVQPEHAPHFTDERGEVWRFRGADLSARDWVVVEAAPPQQPQ